MTDRSDLDRALKTAVEFVASQMRRAPGSSPSVLLRQVLETPFGRAVWVQGGMLHRIALVRDGFGVSLSIARVVERWDPLSPLLGMPDEEFDQELAPGSK